MRLRLLLGLTGAALIGSVVVMVGSRNCNSNKRDSQTATLEGDESASVNNRAVSITETSPQLKYVPKLATPVAPSPIASPKSHYEDALMARLHELGESDPAASLQLAREGNERFPSGAGAAERGWIVCRSLTNMQRFDEAREEARVMVQKYHGTTWANDVAKHILVNPGTHPAERGYGKKYELE